MKNKLLFLVAIVCLNTGILTAQTTVNVSSGGGLEAAVKANQPNVSLVTNLIVTGQIDARDFRFIRDSLNATLLSLDLSAVSIVAYSGTGGTQFTPPPFFGAGGGADVDASYDADVVPQNAFYKTWTEGSFWAETVELKMTALTTLQLPAGITKIDPYALAGIKQLDSLNLSVLTQLLSIERNAFYKCESMETISLPSTVTSLGAAMFGYCTSLQSVTIPNSVISLANETGFFEGCTSLASVIFQEPCQITTLPYRMFYSDLTSPYLQLGALATVTVPSSVTDVSTAFEVFLGTAIECHPANTVYESIGGVLYLKSDHSIVTLPKGITSFTIPATMTEIPDGMFENCINLTSVTVLSNLTKIGDRAFYNCPITSFTFPSTLQEIGESAFYNTNLTDVSFTDNAALTTIGNEVFQYNIHLTTADLSGLTVLGQSMFRVCESLETVTFKSNLAAIPTAAFEGCAELVSVVIPNTVTSIGDYAFGSCYKLTTVNLPTALVSLGAGVFQNNTLIPAFHIPQNLTTLTYDYSGHAFTSTFGTITVDAANPNFAAEDGMLLDKAKSKLYHIPASATVKSIVLPATVDTVLTYAFNLNSNRNIKKLTLPAGLKQIENYGLDAADKLDTLITKAIVPPVCTNSSLNNRWTEERPVVIVPPRTLAAYKAADGWKNYYGTDFDAFVAANWFEVTGAGYAISVSPNGNYVVGSGPWLQDLYTGTPVYIGTRTAMAVNDAGMVAGIFEGTLNGQGLDNGIGGVYRNGTLYPLGYGRYGTPASISEANSARPEVGGITANGDVYGMSCKFGNMNIIPFIWKYNEQYDNYTTDTLAWASPAVSEGDYGARFTGVSSDGTVASGWVARWMYGVTRRGLVWTSPTDYVIIDEVYHNEAQGVSPNGKYIAVKKDNKAAIYDVENNTTRIFGEYGSASMAVSDNGFVVGTDGKKAFIWSDKLGYMYFDRFLEKYCPDIVLPYDPIVSFFQDDGLNSNVPMSISADGLVICGWSGYSAVSCKGWILRLADTPDLVDRPRNLTAEAPVADRNKVVLNWDAPAEYGTHVLDFYYIYRDGAYINRIEAWEGTSYTDLNVSAGKHIYGVSAVFDYENPTTYFESGQADNVWVTIVDNYDLPFHEDFEYGFETNFWSNTMLPNHGWITAAETGFTGIFSALFMAMGNRDSYDHNLTSKPFNAAGASKVVLSYVYQVAAYADEWLGKKDTVKVEVSNGAGPDAVWHTVQTHVIDAAKEWTPITLDISSDAAGHLFKVRFHCISGDNRTFFNFDVDNFGLALESNDIAPTGVKAYRFDGDNIEHVVYKDRTGAYGLTHTRAEIIQLIGNLGEPFIAAQKFDANDLKPYQGKYLTSISAFIFPDIPGWIPTELKLAVWVNGNRVESGAIPSFEGNAWNTFKLSTPIHLTGSETIIAGIEVAQHDYEALPLAMDISNSEQTNAKGNLLSYDNGITWTNPNVEENFPGMWAIAANVRDESSAQPVDKDELEIAYQIIRNGTVVATLYRNQHYTETAIANACYTVKSFRVFGGLSPESAPACEEILTLIKPIELVSLDIYPNPATDVVRISGDFKQVCIYDQVGRLVMTTDKNEVNVEHLAKGVYVFKTTLSDGKTAMTKLVKK